MKILELFSGIGGMHYALDASEVHGEVLAVEINTIANDVYRMNFPSTKLMQKNIVSLKAETLNSFGPEIILMSPPCQPFTRVGLKRDLGDVRTDPFKHILSLLGGLPTVKYILLENVKGFEESEARKELITCLQDLNFNMVELLISPTQLGIPNMRTRYYLLAKRNPLQFIFESINILKEIPEEGLKLLNIIQSRFPLIRSLEDILETDDTNSTIFQDHLLPDNLFKTRIRVMDIVAPTDTRTCCFTKAYGSYAKGTGSVLCPFDQSKISRINQEPLESVAVNDLKLRFFTPREIARLMCFPEAFIFPTHTTRKQKYRLLGNSVNVLVVALLIKLMLSEPNSDQTENPTTVF